MRLPMPFPLTALLLALLAGCGFQLRGSVDLPAGWDSVHLVSASPNGELAHAVRAGFERGGVEVTGRDAASFVLRLGDETVERRNLTIGPNARAAEFELTMTTTVQVSDPNGNELLAKSRLSARGVMRHNPQNVTGKEEEVRLLHLEMRRSLVQQVLRKVRFLATAPGPSR